VSLLHKPLDQLTEQDFHALVLSQTPESRFLDYKEKLPINGDEKRDFLYDITAFANTSGGELIFGISEERDAHGKPTGRPLDMLGVEIDNVDALLRQIEDFIRSNVQPRILGLQMRALKLKNGEHIFIVRIPNSLNSPHMVDLLGTQRFYYRASTGKQLMDVQEIRSAFLATTEMSERIRSFHLERLTKIRVNEGFSKLQDVKGTEAVLVTHIIPFSAFGNTQLDIPSLRKQLMNQNLTPISHSDYSHRVNFEGLLTYSKYDHISLPWAYTQFMKTGVIEAVDKAMLYNEEQDVYADWLETELVEKGSKYLSALHDSVITPPIIIRIALLNVKNYFIKRKIKTFEQNDLLLPELILEEMPLDRSDFGTKLKPAFNALWNAAGYEGSPSYQNPEGIWRLK
jgi:hypothetical protein